MMIEMCVPNSMRATEHRDTEKKQHELSGKLPYSQRSMITIMGLSKRGGKKEKSRHKCRQPPPLPRAPP
jgi:hypothetical protein